MVYRVQRDKMPDDLVHPQEITHPDRVLVLEQVERADYLGVTHHQSTSWGPHCIKVARKADRTRMLLQRNLKTAPKDVKTQCYVSLVRPTLEYAATVWDPPNQTDANRLEKVQRRCARYVCNDFSRYSSVTEMLESLQWDTLAERRAKAKAVMMYRIRHDQVDISLHDHFNQLTTRSRGNPDKFRVP